MNLDAILKHVAIAVITGAAGGIGLAAAELCARLRERYQAHAFTHLVLVAPPRFLGFLRDALDHQIASRVLASVDLDLTHCTTPDVVRAHLPDPLY